MIDLSDEANPVPLLARKTTFYNYTVTLAGEYA